MSKQNPEYSLWMERLAVWEAEIKRRQIDEITHIRGYKKVNLADLQ